MLNEYVYILEVALDILDKLIHDFRNVAGCLALNEMNIKLASLIICSINDNLSNKSSIPPPEVKKKTTKKVKNNTVYSTFNNFM